MKEAQIPFKKIIFVCTNVREGEEACSNPERGSNCGMSLLETLREEVKKRGLKGKIRVAKSGCMDLCAAGPNIMVFNSNGSQKWVSRISQAELPHFIEEHLKI
ncbi:MAG: (2Fe-2S) ferredoxin domain-containing protein [Elusimicrobia bacterium]|nr:(2Fe-2S) ferredoxin domain-containing protein [Elusimicrobiota bacterium]